MSAVTWEQLFSWAAEHGAKNKKITSVRIGGMKSGFPVVEIEGMEELPNGKAFMGLDDGPATWKVTSGLIRLP